VVRVGVMARVRARVRLFGGNGHYNAEGLGVKWVGYI
jgi:hypothetical protein